MFDNDTAEIPNKKATIGIGNSKNIPNKANAGARHTTHRLIIDNNATTAVEEMCENSSFLNFSLKIENIIDKTMKMAVKKAGIINSHLGWNNWVIKS